MNNSKQAHDAFHAYLRTDFKKYLRKVFDFLEGNRDFQDNWHLDAIVQHLMQAYEGSDRRQVIALPPRHLKSLTISVAFTTWILGRDPTLRIICSGYAEDLVKHFALQTREIMQSDWYKKTFPGTRISKSKNTQTEIATTKGGCRLAVPIGGGFTGRGADWIIIDDPVKASASTSDSDRKFVNDRFDNTIFTRLDDKAEGRIIVTMQRIHVDDLAGHVLKKNGWNVLSIPAIATEDEEIPVGPGETYSRSKDEVLHANRESMETLKAIREQIGTANFEPQYQQRPIAEGGILFKEEWIRFFNRETFDIFSDNIVQSWDTASKTADNNSWSVCTTWVELNKRFYLLDVHRGRWEFPELKNEIIRMYRRWNPQQVIIEDASSGIALGQTLLRTTDLPIWGVPAKLDKETRFAEASIFFERGQVWFPDKAPWLDECVAELLAFPGGRFNDQVDSIVQYLLWMLERMPVRRRSIVTPITNYIDDFDYEMGGFTEAGSAGLPSQRKRYWGWL